MRRGETLFHPLSCLIQLEVISRELDVARRLGNRFAESLFPYKGLEKVPVLNFLAIMFLVVARIRTEHRKE